MADPISLTEKRPQSVFRKTKGMWKRKPHLKPMLVFLFKLIKMADVFTFDAKGQLSRYLNKISIVGNNTPTWHWRK